ncbi:MAG TPA: Gfo/Idh/MocA family oxidoreductase, partial [Armatimonadota bacterium]|nr:Gfo/Idh/MocA family oxidoreductase [Armatimonadota bacterium]
MFSGIVVGLGGRGLHWLAQVRERDDCRIVAYVEPSEANRARAVREHGVPEEQVFPSLEGALEAVRADFLLDVTPPASHAAVAEQAFAAGLHVLGEKPLSDDFEAAQRVANTGTQAGLRHMITQNYRFGE